MIRALLKHIILLASFRHDGSGMPSKVQGILLITALYFVWFYVRFYNSITIATSITAFFIWFILSILVEKKAFCMLMMVGISATLISLPIAYISHIPMSSNLWTLVEAVLFFSYFQNKNKKALNK